MCCSDCGHVNQRDEDFYTLSVQVRDKKDIFESLQHMTNGEIIDGYRCEACCVGDKTVEITKKVVVKRLPNTLIVHLNRIIFDMDTLRNVKVNDRFEFP